LFKSVNKNIVGVLEPDSEVLADIEANYSTLIRGRIIGKHEIDVVGFYEEHEVRLVGFIVPKHSAKLGAYENIGITANHMDMAKFRDENDVGYTRVCGEVCEWLRRLSEEQPGTQTGQA
jgi:hypothetical protein